MKQAITTSLSDKEKNHGLTNVAYIYDRVLKADVKGIATTNDLFLLDNGYYVNENETIICRSTNDTGKFFKKVH